MLKSTKYIEYNLLNSLIEFISNQIKERVKDVNVTIGDVKILPSYPDLTKFHEPSIILQKIDSENHSIAMGNMLGQYSDEHGDIDVHGKVFEVLYQIDIISKNRSIMYILLDMVSNILNCNTLPKDADNYLPIELREYLVGSSKELIGHINVTDDLYCYHSDVGINKVHRAMIRTEFTTMNLIIPEYDMIDLSKPVKVSQTIKIKEE